jgi:hypothetical protein
MHSSEQTTPLAASMSITVQTTENEFNIASALLSRPARGRALLCVIAAAVLAALAAPAIINVIASAVDLSVLPGGHFIVLGIIFLALYIALLRGFSRFYQQGRFAPDGNYLQPTAFSMSSRGLNTASRYLRSEVEWRGVLKLRDHPTFLFFYIDRMHAFIIPKRCFASPEAATAFYQQAQSYWQAARQQTLPKDAA